MELITPYFLLELIVFDISDSIHIHRESKNYYWLFTATGPATINEVENFIHSTPFYNNELKAFLLGRKTKALLITTGWLETFYEKTSQWSESDEWLYYDATYICHPWLNQKPDRVPLKMPW